LLAQEIDEQEGERGAATLLANTRTYVLLIMKYHRKKGLVAFPFRKQVPDAPPRLSDPRSALIHVLLCFKCVHYYQ
jgi:hypothetical protein